MIKYRLVRSGRKTLAVEVNAEGEVTVRAPYRLSSEKIEAFISERSAWIENAVERQKKRKSEQHEYTPAELENLRQLAKSVIPEKVRFYSEIMNVKPLCVKINSAKKRFGSCSGKNSLNFSLYLMEKDERAIDYVVVHELAHIKHHNHSKEFYDFVGEIMPDYKSREKLLKNK